MTAPAAQPDLFSRHAYPIGVPPAVCDLFESLALDVHAAGHTRFSADAILHKIRWEMTIERKDSAFKVNNSHSSVLARWFLARHPEKRGFFELRERLADSYRDEAAA